jgi:hypothetical protein
MKMTHETKLRLLGHDFRDLTNHDVIHLNRTFEALKDLIEFFAVHDAMICYVD